MIRKSHNFRSFSKVHPSPFKRQPEAFYEKGVLRNFAKFTGKYLCKSLFFNKVAGLILWHRCFRVSFAKSLRTPFFTEHLRRLLLPFLRYLSKHFSNFQKWFLKQLRNIDDAATDMRYFARSKFSRSLVHKKKFSLIWQRFFRLGYVFCEER